MKIRPHELAALREMIAYARSISAILPDKGDSTFAAKMRAHAQIIEDMLERIEGDGHIGQSVI